jgi:hypothetical protein
MTYNHEMPWTLGCNTEFLIPGWQAQPRHLCVRLAREGYMSNLTTFLWSFLRTPILMHSKGIYSDLQWHEIYVGRVPVSVYFATFHPLTRQGIIFQLRCIRHTQTSISSSSSHWSQQFPYIVGNRCRPDSIWPVFASKMLCNIC